MKIKKETKTVKYEDLCFGDVFEIDGKFFMKANDCGYWKAMAEYMMLLMGTKILVWSFQ